MGVIGVVLMLFGPELWGPQVAVITIVVATLLVCGCDWRRGL